MEDATSKGVQVAGWAMRLGMLAVILLPATKASSSVPRDRILAALK